MKSKYPNYNPLDWIKYIEKCTNLADKYPLCKCDGIWITENELKTIKNLQNKVLERLAFTLLCLAKFQNFKNPNNNNWINNEDSEIFKLACINTPAYEKSIKLGILKDFGLISFAKKINNLSLQILYIDNSSENKLFINDFRKLGYEWRLYKGEKYIRCNKCNILVRQTSANKKYCTSCIKENPYYSPILTKTITCIDCGETFEVDSKNTKTTRCDKCKKEYVRIRDRERKRKYRLSQAHF